ncbi:DegT/DnrJ/EryC1/StrS family aminotransferase [Alphaproteobacteria bacterium]|nr:DegT/DnrJ/EryC1/StrS family aminotransferase [Alphaproteobacteria bacterium]
MAGVLKLESSIEFLQLLSDKEKEEQIREAISEVISSKSFIGGELVEKFETTFAHRVGAKYCVSVNSGYDALALSIKSLDLAAGARAIVPGHTFAATWYAAHNNNLKLLPIDIDSTDACMNTRLLPVDINETDVIMPVHLYGHSAQIEKITHLRQKYGCSIIEDCAQSFGTELNSRRIGSHGNINCWSFYPGKNLGALGDGGAITTDCPVRYNNLKKIRNYGGDQKYKHDMFGVNSRLDALQAAILLVNLRWIERENERRRDIASFYLNNIKNEYIELVRPQTNVNSSWHLFVLRVSNREHLQNYLEQSGVASSIHYPYHLPDLPLFNSYKTANLPKSKQHANQCLSVPIGPHLTDLEVEKITQVLNDYQPSIF